MARFAVKKLAVIVAWVAGSLVFLCIALVAALYFWPLTNTALQQAKPQPLSYQEAMGQHARQVQAETAAGVKDTCRSILLTHGQKSAKAVVMLHGYSSCPGQFNELAKYFYERGYNVYVPRAPQHGLTNATTETFSDTDLANYANEALNTAQGLGEEIGAVGLSGGGVLATWLAQYRNTVQRLLVISPFYETSAERLQKWLTKPFIVLYGSGILPNVIADGGLQYRSLAQYLRIVANYKANPQSDALQSIASVVASGDREIDHALAQSIPQTMAQANNVPFLWCQPPAEWNLGHDIVGAYNNADIGTHAAELYEIYFDMYEGRKR